MDIVEGIIEPDCQQDSVRCFNYNFLEHPYQWWRVETERRAKLSKKKDSTLKTPPAAAAAAAKKAAAQAAGAGTGTGTTNETDLLLISKATSFQQQLRLFFYRSMYLLKKSTGMADIFLVSFVATLSAVSCAKLIQKFGVNLVAASLANQAVALGASMVAVVMAIPEFETERLMFERERNVGLNVYYFFIAKFASSLFIMTLMPFIFTIVYTCVLHFFCWLWSPTSVYRVPRSIRSFGGCLQFYWMLVVNAFSAASHAQLISMLLPADKAMLMGVLMLVFMNLASNISETLGEISFMNTFNLWALTLDAMPENQIEQKSKHRAITIALQEATCAQAANNDTNQADITIAVIAEKMIPKLKDDNDILRSYNIHRNIGHKAEGVLFLTGMFMRGVAMCILAQENEIAMSLVGLYLISWWLGMFRVTETDTMKVSKKEKNLVNDAVNCLKQLSNKSEEELDMMIRMASASM